MDIYEELKGVLLEKDYNGYEEKNLLAIMKITNKDILKKYNYTITSFWHLYSLSIEEFQHIHPNVLLANRKKVHLLPNRLLKNMSAEQVYSLFKYPTIIDNISLGIIECWLDIHQDNMLSTKDFIERGCPELKKSYSHLSLYELIQQIHTKKIQEKKLESKLKPNEFYETFDIISLTDVYRMLYGCCGTASQKSPAQIKQILYQVKGIKEAVIDEELGLYSYSQILKALQQYYSYNQIKDLKDCCSLLELQSQYFKHIGYENVDALKRAYLYFDDMHYKKLPSMQLSEKKIIYFYKDVIKYIEGK